MESTWPCEAYGPGSVEQGVLCFLAEKGQRVCVGPRDCREAMTLERQAVFRRINELAATGDEVGEYLSQQFASPTELLGGDGEGSAPPPCR